MAITMNKNWSMWNPLSMIPDAIDPKLRQILVWLIIIQFFGFCVYFALMIKEYYRYKREGPLKEDLIENGQESITTVTTGDTTNPATTTNTNTNKVKKN